MKPIQLLGNVRLRAYQFFTEPLQLTVHRPVINRAAELHYCSTQQLRINYIPGLNTLAGQLSNLVLQLALFRVCQSARRGDFSLSKSETIINLVLKLSNNVVEL